MKQCPNCQALIYASLRKCPECEYEYPEQETLPNHGTKAFDGAVLTDQIQPYWMRVKLVEYTRHIKDGKPDSVKITYITKGGERYGHWLCFEHGGFASRKALEFTNHIGSEATSVSEALAETHTWPFPRRIKCKQDDKFCRVIEWDYTKETQETL